MIIEALSAYSIGLLTGVFLKRKKKEDWSLSETIEVNEYLYVQFDLLYSSLGNGYYKSIQIIIKADESVDVYFLNNSGFRTFSKEILHNNNRRHIDSLQGELNVKKHIYILGGEGNYNYTKHMIVRSSKHNKDKSVNVLIKADRIFHHEILQEGKV